MTEGTLILHSCAHLERWDRPAAGVEASPCSRCLIERSRPHADPLLADLAARIAALPATATRLRLADALEHAADARHYRARGLGAAASIQLYAAAAIVLRLAATGPLAWPALGLAEAVVHAAGGRDAAAHTALSRS